MQQSWYESMMFVFSQFLVDIAVYLPRIAAALILFVIGTLIARLVKKSVIQAIKGFQLSKAIKQTPIEEFLKHAEIGLKFDELVGVLAYWVVMLVVIHSAVSALGLDALTSVLERIINYLPRLAAGVIVLFFGVLLAGVAESFVKSSLRRFDAVAARILGKASSYFVMIIAVMAAVSELKIAEEFILILFVGFVAAVSIGVGLSFGLGSQKVVNKLLDEWYTKLKKASKE